jgi:threonine/homoserine/homoserine lactone efflux protein
MSLAHPISGLILGFTAGMAPGPLLTLVVSQSLSYGIKEGVKVALAPLLTDTPIILATVFLGSRLAADSPVLGLLALSGAVYICWLAWESLTIKPVTRNDPARQPHSFRKGVLANVFNPHPYLFWITVGTPLLVSSWALNPTDTVLWLMGFYVMLVGSKVVLATLVGHWGQLLQGQPYLWINRCLGIALLFFAAALARDGLSLLR